MSSTLRSSPNEEASQLLRELVADLEGFSPIGSMREPTPVPRQDESPPATAANPIDPLPSAEPSAESTAEPGPELVNATVQPAPGLLRRCLAWLFGR